MRRAHTVILAAVGCAAAAGAAWLMLRRSTGPGLPGPDRHPAVSGLPDPFRFADGRRVATRAEWARRRKEFAELLSRYQYGHAPPAPAPGQVRAREIASEAVHGGRAHKKTVRLTLGADGGLGFEIGLVIPAGRGPFPAIVNVDHRSIFAALAATEEIVARGYVFVGYDPTQLDPDEPNAIGPAQAAHPDRDWGTIAVWAWGASRVVDHLVARADVDRRRLALSGHSRSGKTALWAGALDERVALVAPQGSGCGGVASYRFREEGCERLAVMCQSFPHWFLPRLAAFGGREERLPFDQHFVVALVAPRAFISIDALGDRWANLPGTQATFLGARPVWELLSAAERIGISFRPGAHGLSDEDWRTLLDFADLVFFGKTPPSGRRFDVRPFPEPPGLRAWSTSVLR
jgi:hypothetical protein